MNSCVYICKLTHLREKPKKNSFSYNIYMMYLDLDELENLNKNLFLFGYNSWNIFGFYDSDHFKFLKNKSKEADIISKEKVIYDVEKYKNKNTRERIEILINEQNLDFKLGKIFVLTNLRNLGYIFNPVSFYYCYDNKGKFRALFSEVNNTFGDQKMYYIDLENQAGDIYQTKEKKNYYISPFTKLENTLHWKFNDPKDSMLMSINSSKGDEIELRTLLVGKRKELKNYTLFYLQLRYPLTTLVTVYRIHYQALKLWIKGVSFNRKEESDKKIIKNIKT